MWLHEGFLQAGSDLILTNSFGGTGFRERLHNAQDRTRELNVAPAIEAAKATGLTICATMTFDTASHSIMGVMPADFAKFTSGLGANFI